MTNIIKQDAKRVSECNIPWKELDEKTVFITGATGFIGASLVRSLLSRTEQGKEKIRVIAAVRNLSKAKELFAEYSNKYLDYYVGDICAPINYAEKVDYVIHCASNAAPEEYANDPVGTMKINFLGTTNILEFAKEKKVNKFVYVSTIEIYGNTDLSTEIKEDEYGIISADNVRSCYPISKKACETLVFSYGKQYQIPVSVGRLSYIFGAGMKENDSKVVSVLARNVARRENMILKSKGTQLRSYTYISDAITGLLTIMLLGENQNAYNISSSLCITTIAGLGEALEEIFCDYGVKLCYELPSEEEKSKFSPIRNSVLSNEKLKKLGWVDAVDLKTGLRKMVESIEATTVRG